MSYVILCDINSLFFLSTVPGATHPCKLPCPEPHTMTSVVFLPFPQFPVPCLTKFVWPQLHTTHSMFLSYSTVPNLAAPMARVAYYDFNRLFFLLRIFGTSQSLQLPLTELHTIFSLPIVPGASQPWKYPWPELRATIAAVFSLPPQFPVPHSRGSSHGQSRIIRRAYSKMCYAQMMSEAYDKWHQLEKDLGQELIV